METEQIIKPFTKCEDVLMLRAGIKGTSLYVEFVTGEIKRFDMTDTINNNEYFDRMKKYPACINDFTIEGGGICICWDDWMDMLGSYIYDNSENVDSFPDIEIRECEKGRGRFVRMVARIFRLPLGYEKHWGYSYPKAVSKS